MDERSEANLAHVEPDLVKVVRLAAEAVNFIVIAGLRSAADEEKAVASGHSTTLHSRHLADKAGLAAAVDLAAVRLGAIVWEPSFYPPIAMAMKAAARQLGVDIQWGGDWITFKDWGHFQLPWESYP